MKTVESPASSRRAPRLRIAEPAPAFFRTKARRASTVPQELIVDNFAGGGGASLGIELATGRAVDISINHNPDAVAMHAVNHPASRHLCESVWDVDPVAVCKGRAVGLAWFSPDCRHFSRAKGGKPVKKNVRGLAWIVVKWAKLVRPRVIILENVREFETWGPLTADMMPCPARKGDTFRRWWRSLERLGYVVEKRILDAADYGAPTHRRRLFVVARCDGALIVWPERTHGVSPELRGDRKKSRNQQTKSADSGTTGIAKDQSSTRLRPVDYRLARTLKPYRTAAECIDWSIPCPSIFDRNRPLAEKTLRRIAMGLKRYVLEAAEPFIVQVNHGGDEFRGQGLDRPLTTVSSKHGFGLVTPYIARCAHGDSVDGKEHWGKSAHDIAEPLPTMTWTKDFAVVAPTLIQTGYGERPCTVKCVACGWKSKQQQPSAECPDCLAPMGLVTRYGQAPRTLDLQKPLGTMVGSQKHALVAAFLSKHYGGVIGHELTRPIGTVTAIDHHSLTAAHLTVMHGGKGPQFSGVDAPLGTVTSQGLKFGLVYAFLTKYFGTAVGAPLTEPLHTVTGKHRFGFVQIEVSPGHHETAVALDVAVVGPCIIADIGMRMLSPRELLAATMTPELAAEYILTGSKANQVHKIGNMVVPLMAKALVAANFATPVEAEVA